MTVRAKMKVTEIEAREDGEGGSVVLEAVISGSHENEEFFRWTPYGKVHLGTINKTAFQQFELGAEFYVDFTRAS